MGLIDSIKNAFHRTPKLSDRQRIRDLLVRELVMATDLADTLCNAFRRGNRVRITIQVDDIDCGTGILARANEPLIEYFANWAVAEKMAKNDRLEEFDKSGGGQTRWEQENGSGDFPESSNLGAAPKNGALGS